MSSNNHNMEPKLFSAVFNSGFLHRLLPVVGPALLISVGYVDPGKWAATIEGGARFGFSLVAPMLFFNLAAVLCQSLSARVGVVTGKDLAKICSDEYDACTCMLLGVQTAISVVALDLSMILGIAHGLNLLFGVELSTCVLITAVDAVLFPLFAAFLERCKANFLCTCIAGLLLLLYILGVRVNQLEMPFSIGGLPTKFEESAYTVMSLLGASILPHNLFLHSSIVLQLGGQPNVSKEALYQKHFFAILFIFSGIYLVNHALMNSAANVFYNTGLVLLTFPDAMALMEQVLRSPVAPFGFLLFVYFANQIMALTWNHGGNVVMHDFLRLDLPNWLQRATIRIAAIVPALYCVWTSGLEGVYQLLIFTQVMVAILLPSSVIPLFRVASSRPIMGVHKMSQILEFLALITCLGMLGIKSIFVVEMIFGDSDWVGNLRWNMGSSSSVPYIVLLVTSCLSFSLMLWLAATPLKSATRLGAQMLNWDLQNSITEPAICREENLSTQTEPVQNDEGREVNDTFADAAVTDAVDYGLPEAIMELDQEYQLTANVENCSEGPFVSSPPCIKEESVSSKRSLPNSNEASENADSCLTNAKTVRDESVEPIEKTVSIEGDLHNEQDEDEVDSWEPEESSRAVPGSTSSIVSDGPASFRSLSGKSEDGGNGTGSLSRLAGLGRAARRQLAAILDEFWGQLYDFHGQPTQEAKFKKLDMLLGDTKPVSSFLKVETTGKEFGRYYSSGSIRGPDSLINSGFCDSPKQPRILSSIEPSYGAKRGSSSLWSSNHVQLLDAYVQASNASTVDSSERRYSSMRSLPSSNAWDYQPNTVHGYGFASLVNHYAKDRALLNGQMESPTPLSPSMGVRNYRDPMAIAMAQKLQNGSSSSQASRYQSPAASRISPLQSEYPYQNINPSDSADSAAMSTNAKKYHSLPDISGLSVSYRNLYASETGSQWDKPAGFGPSACRTSYDSSSFNLNTGSRSGSHLKFDELSKGYGGTSFNVASDHGSLWAKQPYEQFGVADKSRAVGSKVGFRSSSNTQEAICHVDSESQLLQSFRCCILKLLKLEGSDWLFRQNDGADEDLIDSVAARERCWYEAEAIEMTRGRHLGEPQCLFSDRKPGSTIKNDEASIASFVVSSVPNCGDGCVYKADLVISFGVWCIHRILDLSLMESRPELWGKYTYVLNRLQGIIDPAFSKPRTPMSACFCLQLSADQVQRSSPPVSHGMLPPPSKPGRGKCTTAPMLLELIKDVEIAISCRKGRSGTAAGDVAFPKGKENLASVLKRYKRRLTNKPVGSK